jgi:hypothetical protein
MGEFGRTALLLAAAIDAAPEPLEHGPSTYVPMGGNLVPGWTLALLALALLLPPALAAADGFRRGSAAAGSPGWALAWAASRALPLLAGLFFFYFLALVGLVARPAFPFDPNLFAVGPGQIIVMLLCALVVGAAYCAMRSWRVPAALSRSAAVPAIGAVSTLAVLLAWLANPFLGLLLVPTAHVWLTCARRRGPLPWPAVAASALVSLVPLILTVDHLSGQLALGGSAPWLLLLMVSGGQIGFGTMFSLCLVLGALLGVLALSLRRPAPRRPRRSRYAPAGSPRREDRPLPVGAPVEHLDTNPITSSRPGDDLRYDG